LQILPAVDAVLKTATKPLSIREVIDIFDGKTLNNAAFIYVLPFFLSTSSTLHEKCSFGMLPSFSLSIEGGMEQ
jgi:membrane protein CcdC involved in cytochrome C biogenesis